MCDYARQALVLQHSRGAQLRKLCSRLHHSKDRLNRPNRDSQVISCKFVAPQMQRLSGPAAPCSTMQVVRGQLCRRTECRNADPGRAALRASPSDRHVSRCYDRLRYSRQTLHGASDECPVQVQWLQLLTTRRIRITTLPLVFLFYVDELSAIASLWSPGWE